MEEARQPQLHNINTIDPVSTEWNYLFRNLPPDKQRQFWDDYKVFWSAFSSNTLEIPEPLERLKLFQDLSPAKQSQFWANYEDFWSTFSSSNSKIPESSTVASSDSGEQTASASASGSSPPASSLASAPPRLRICPLCGASTRRLKRHQETKCTGPQNKPVFRCNVLGCGKVVGRRDNLRRHMKECHGQ